VCAIAGAHARNAAHVERRHARAIASTHVTRRQCSFEENVIAWTEGTRDHCAACTCTRRRMRACRAAACACNRRRMRACRCTHARMSRGGGAVSKRTYSPGQKEHVISAQHARSVAGAHARNAAHVERRHARALAGAHECMWMHACAHVARRQRGFEENVLTWTEGTRDQKSHGNFLHYCSVTSKLDTKCFLVRFPALFK
jgi:hypothetical protein